MMANILNTPSTLHVHIEEKARRKRFLVAYLLNLLFLPKEILEDIDRKVLNLSTSCK